jgi:lipopolysaccharide biosynthesis glycosyltransferase
MLYPTDRFSREIALVCCGDERYAMPMAAMLCSASLNLSPTYRLRAFVIDGGISNQSRLRFDRKIATLENVELEWRKIDATALQNLPTSRHLLSSVYLRLLMGEVLPPDLSRVIYLDVDLIVESDLAELWREPLGDRIILAVRNYSRSQMRPYLPLPGVPPEQRRLGRYFNSGVMLVNLSQWREENIGASVLDYIRKHPGAIRFGDQDGLNAVLFRRWGELDVSWNVQVDKLLHPEQLGEGEMYDEIRQRRRELLNTPRICHFVGGQKPWHSGRMRPVRSQFLRYLHASHWYNPLGLAGFHLRWFFSTGKLASRMAFQKLIANRPETTANHPVVGRVPVHR